MSFLCSLPLAAQLFGACAPAAPLAVGYVEGDYVLLAPNSCAASGSEHRKLMVFAPSLRPVWR